MAWGRLPAIRGRGVARPEDNEAGRCPFVACASSHQRSEAYCSRDWMDVF